MRPSQRHANPARTGRSRRDKRLQNIAEQPRLRDELVFEQGPTERAGVFTSVLLTCGNEIQLQIWVHCPLG